MAPIDDVIEAMKSQEPGEQLSYRKYAQKFNVDRTTLARRCKGSQQSVEAPEVKRQKLSPQQELELVEYIASL
ncbi:hypothetical protein CC80DRAFT_365265, partial [Byssothecium circinans]